MELYTRLVYNTNFIRFYLKQGSYASRVEFFILVEETVGPKSLQAILNENGP